MTRGVERALRDDLTWRFGQDLRVIGESSAAAALRRLAEVHDLVTCEKKLAA
jgi:hypothetical protein